MPAWLAFGYQSRARVTFSRSWACTVEAMGAATEIPAASAAEARMKSRRLMPRGFQATLVVAIANGERWDGME
jgi:hypothetical protein